MSIEKEMVRIACKALDDKKAKDIKDLERIWRDGKILDAEEFLGENE